MVIAIPTPEIAADMVDVLDPMATGIAILDEDLRVQHANPAFLELIGASRWRGCPLPVLGESAVVLTQLIERMRAAHAPLLVRSCELVAHTPLLRADVAVGPWRGNGVLLEVHALGPDVATTAAPISQSLRGLAHEVKNPLAGLRGAAQLLRRRAAEPDQQRLAELIIAEADRLAALTDRLLHPSGKPHLRVVNLHEIAERARALIAAEAAPEVQLQRDYDPSLPAFRADADRLLQLLLNLLRNALQAGAACIALRTRAEYAALIAGQPVRLAVRLDVIDDGHGVPESLRASVFAPLVSGRTDGTGLGLALAREIAREHDGALDFRSRPGHTVFTLMLPLESTHA
ncbi:MAG: nitrogen regulation protein NR(II) [Rudaea sp.]